MAVFFALNARESQGEGIGVVFSETIPARCYFIATLP